jgi:hypothetical protein
MFYVRWLIGLAIQSSISRPPLDKLASCGPFRLAPLELGNDLALDPFESFPCVSLDYAFAPTVSSYARRTPFTFESASISELPFCIINLPLFPPVIERGSRRFSVFSA